MRAITVIPGQPGSAAIRELPEPEPAEHELLVETLALGVCGTDREIVSGHYGEPPEGRDRLVLGHELLGRVRESPDGSGFEPGELVAGIVRRPDPVPCACCARGEWDMCRNGRYREHGIKGLDGFGAELVRLEVDFAIPVDSRLGPLAVLTEPASVLAKAWEQVDRIRTRGCTVHERLLVTGAGPVGLLGALMGRQRGLEVHVLDLAERGVKPNLARALGADYHTGDIAAVCASAPPDVVLECTGVAQLVVDAMWHTPPGAAVCLTGVGSSQTIPVDVGSLNNALVLENRVVFGSVNANRRHFLQAVEALLRADPKWLEGLITRRVPFERWQEALAKGDDDVKTVVELSA
jgi:threonine dehydrogenase-like Zn-dependent dehydrogenase